MIVYIIGWLSLILAALQFCFMLADAKEHGVSSNRHFMLIGYLLVIVWCFK